MHLLFNFEMVSSTDANKKKSVTGYPQTKLVTRLDAHSELTMHLVQDGGLELLMEGSRITGHVPVHVLWRIPGDVLPTCLVPAQVKYGTCFSTLGNKTRPVSELAMLPAETDSSREVID